MATNLNLIVVCEGFESSLSKFSYLLGGWRLRQELLPIDQFMLGKRINNRCCDLRQVAAMGNGTSKRICQQVIALTEIAFCHFLKSKQVGIRFRFYDLKPPTW